MKFMSSTAVFFVIAAFAACAASAAPVNDIGELADNEQPGALSENRLRRCVYTHGCDKNGNCGRQRVCREDDEESDAPSGLRQRRCVWTKGCDSNHNCGWQKVCRMKREDAADLDEASSELRQRRTVETNGCDNKGNCGQQRVGWRMKREDDDALEDASLRARLRRCVIHQDCDAAGNCADIKVCRMKREDIAVLEAAMGVYEDEIENHRARRSLNDDSAEEATRPAETLKLRLRRCRVKNDCDWDGNCAVLRVCDLKREDTAMLDAALGVYEDDASSELRQRRTVETNGCDNKGNCGQQRVGWRMKREDDDALEARRSRSSNCLKQCVCTVGTGGSEIDHTVGGRRTRTVDMSGNSHGGQTLRTTVTSGPCSTSSSSTCRTVETC